MNTPRTDEAQFGTGRVSVAFARQLERELAAMTALANRLAEALEASDECLALIEDVGHAAHMNNVSVARGAVQQALAAYENHKQNTP